VFHTSATPISVDGYTLKVGDDEPENFSSPAFSPPDRSNKRDASMGIINPLSTVPTLFEPQHDTLSFAPIAKLTIQKVAYSKFGQYNLRSFFTTT